MTPNHPSADSSPASIAPVASRAKWLTLLAACVGLGMLYVDLFIVNVGIPAISRDLHATLGMVSWMVAGYALVIAVLPMGLGRLGDLWGQRRLYLAGLAIFIVASLGCALAPSIGALIALRVVQSIGAAIMTPTTLAIVTRAFPASERGLALGIYGGVAGLGLVSGPVLGGLLVHGDNWRGIFLINGPIGIVALALALRFVPESRDAQAPPSVDWWGLALLSFGLGGLMLALTLAADGARRSPLVLLSVVLGVVLLALFVVVESRVRWPLVDLALFRNRPFVLASLGFFLFSAALTGSQPYWSLFMQNYWGFTPLQGGLAFVPATALIATLTPFTGLLAQRLGTRLSLIAAAGVFALGVGCLYAARTGAESTYATSLLPALVIRGFGIPLFQTCATLALLGAVAPGMVGLASGTLGMARNVGTAFGVAMLGIVFRQQLTTTLPSHLGDLPAAQATAITAAATTFSVTGPDGARAVAESAILRGFDTLSLVAALFCGIATVTTLCIRPRRTTEETGRASAEVPSGAAVATMAED
jgi:DHA2 family methylenomycin A resistance protein-like MFS transporter